MSRSKGDQRGKRIASEINGRGAYAIVNGRMIKRVGGEEVGSPSAKKEAKTRVGRLRRREEAQIIRAQLD